jgi:hypothetical protein
VTATADHDRWWRTLPARGGDRGFRVLHLADADFTANFLVRDRDTTYVASFDKVFGSEGTEIPKTPYRTPNAKAFAERYVRTVRSEYLDHLLIQG